MQEYIIDIVSKSKFLEHYSQISTSPFLIAMSIVDLVIVAVVVIYILKMMKNTKVSPLIKGIVLLIIITLVSGWLQLYVTNIILESLMRYGLLAALIIFQPEIRKTLEEIGKNKFIKMFAKETRSEEEINQLKENIYKIAVATENLSKQKTGALIVFERDISLNEIASTGIKINSDISVQLLENIFVDKTPLHDGALIIRKNKIDTACAILPLATDEEINKSLGTRHRAAIGISRQTDAIAVVVSEETGKRSVAVAGNLKIGVSDEEFKKLLIKYLITDKERQNAKKIAETITKEKEKEIAKREEKLQEEKKELEKEKKEKEEKQKKLEEKEVKNKTEIETIEIEIKNKEEDKTEDKFED